MCCKVSIINETSTNWELFSAEKLNKTPLNAAFFYVYSGRIFSDQACSENLIQYYTAEEFISESIDAFREAIEVCK